MERLISLSRRDWSLNRKGPIDQARHNEKVKEAIKANLQDIISEEAIISSDGKRVVKVPVRSLELPHFRFDPNKNKQAGQGGGKPEQGKQGSDDGQAVGPGKGKGAGDQPGTDYFEADVTVDELADVLFEDLSLPFMENKGGQDLETEEIEFSDLRKVGSLANLDKRRTILQNIRRNAMGGNPVYGGIRDDDLRFRTWRSDIRRESNAVVIAMRDVSGSMGEFEKYISRSFFFWMVRFLRSKYSNVQMVFITHHTEAKEVDEDTFFKLGESGGTKVSSAYHLALKIIRERYTPQLWNIYPIHFSDGDNWGEKDNNLCVELVYKLMDMSNLFGYGEIQEGGYRSLSTLMSAFQNIQNEHFIGVTITDRKDVYPALKRFFARRDSTEREREAA
ncbi:MAG: sporulation protein YhbH [Chloroflexota bacterium]